MIQKRKAIVALVVALVLALPVFTFALKDEYQQLESQSGLPAGKEFVVQFEQPLKRSTITSKTVYVLNSKGVRVATKASLSSDGKSIIVKPATKYINNSKYTLYIRKGIRYANGKLLQSGLKMSFSIAPYKEGLPMVQSRQNLLQLLADAQKKGDVMRGGSGIDFTFAMPAAMAVQKAESNTAAPATAPMAPAADAGSKDFSSTNIQVQGVDEADIVKTDGEYIYQVKHDSVVITKAYPADKLQVVKTLSYNGTIQPLELYIDEKNMIVIGYSNMSSYYNQKGIMPYYNDGTVVMKIYDISNKTNINEVREIQLEGTYLSSRKVGSELYLVTNKYINYPLIRDNEKMPDVPMYKDTQAGKDFIKVAYNQIRYFPDSNVMNYMVVAGLSLDTPKEKLNVDTYLGAGQEVFCSQENLYVAVTKYSSNQTPTDPIVYDSAVMTKPARPVTYSEDTLVYRFALNRGKLEFVATGNVPGRILNQFSMDEHDNSFRIATTKGNIWEVGENTSKNNLYILDMELKQQGKIEDIAPGEKIYSVRFMGDRAYMVTYRTVDPLFVIDLKDKTKPKILGALKIPGYSDYLHPYDENHIIGFGKDTVEVVHKDEKGNETYRNAYYLGMKIAMFDITDVTQPKELFVEKIGDRGTDSPLLHDHKALLFSKEKNLMAFPVTVMKVQENAPSYGDVPAYGTFSYQGAFVYNVDLQQGFQLKGKITHLTDDEYLKAGQYWYDNDKNIQRILYIGSNLYTISNNKIKANDMSSLKEINTVEIR